MASVDGHDASTRKEKPSSSGSMLPAPTSRLKRPMVSRLSKKNSENIDPTGSKKVRVDAAESIIKPILDKKVVKRPRRSVSRFRPFNATGTKRDAPLSSVSNTATSKRKPTAPITKARPGNASRQTGSVGNAKSTSKTAASVQTASKKSKRPAWDIKGRLADMTEMCDRQAIELEEHKAKTESLDEIIRRLEALENEKKTIQVQSSDQQGEISRLQHQMSSKEADFSAKIRELEETHEREQRTMRINLEECRSDLRKVRKERDELELESRQDKKALKELLENYQNLEVDHKDLQEKQKVALRENQEYTRTIKKQDNDIKEYEEERKRLLNEVIELKGNIRVFCRVRPTIKDESPSDHIDFAGENGKSINVVNADKQNKYQFDKVFTPEATQGQVFTELSQLVQSSLDGYNVCVFAYGQTGSGKTYTMEGPDHMSDESCGVIPRAMKQMFEKRLELVKVGWEYVFHVEQLEIYCETIQDLLRPKNEPAKKLEIRTKKPNGQSGIWVPELSSHKVECYDDVKKLLLISKRRRATAATEANDHSSRSHSVFTLRICSTNNNTGQQTESALNLIDLAGSERCGSNGATGIRFTEGTRINGSLTALSSVISALAKKESHIPYRSSKLTHLLADSLGGNSKTLMVVNINPSPAAAWESVNTLRFATTVNQCNIGTAQKSVKF